MSLCLDTQGEFALPARDYRVVARVIGWYDRLQQSRLAAPGCPACTRVRNQENSPPKDQLANKSQSGSLNCGRIRGSGSVRSCTVGSRRGRCVVLMLVRLRVMIFDIVMTAVVVMIVSVVVIVSVVILRNDDDVILRRNVLVLSCPSDLLLGVLVILIMFIFGRIVLGVVRGVP